MAIFKKLVILVLIWACPLAVAVAEEAQSSQGQEIDQLLWTERKIPHNILSEFSQIMNENEIVAALRKKDNLKVIILEGKAELKNPNLTVGNLEEDQPLVDYLIQERKALNEDLDDAYHLSPYEHSHMPNVLQRPEAFMGFYSIVIPRSASREKIIHEFFHYTLKTLAPSSPMEVEGTLHHPKCTAFLEIQKLEKELKDKQLKFYRWATPQDQKDSLEKEILLLGGQHLLKGLDYLLSFYGEEMDVHRFMAEHRTELNLTPQEVARAKDRVNGYIGLLLDKLYTELHIMIWTDKFRKSHWNTDSEVKNLYSVQIVGLLEKMQANMDLTNQWSSLASVKD